VSTALLAAVLQQAGAADLPGAGIAQVDAARAAARALLARHTALADARSEAWRYTSLRALEAQALPLAAAVDEARDIALPRALGPRLVFIDGHYAPHHSQLAGLPAGITFKPLGALRAEDWQTHAALLQCSDDAGDALAPLNLALASAGVLLNVQPGVVVEAPIEVIYLGAAAQPCAWHARSRVVLGAGARVTLLERQLGAGAGLATLHATYHIHADARLDLVQMQEADAALNLLRTSTLTLAARAALRMHALDLGAALTRHALGVHLQGAQARVELRYVVALDRRQHADLQLDLRHEVGDTRCDVRCRAVAAGRARAVLQGAISIAAGADGSDAALGTHNLLLSDQAEIDVRPVLEIHADEVRAAHGASVGQLDATMLFYLRARGLPVAEARALLTAAHCRAVLDDIVHADLRTAAMQALDARIQSLR
jgi:Fe-S cluster assembly protein SufD